MADGDITSIKQLGRVLLPGGGNTTSGKQVQQKILVWGTIACSYHSTGVKLNDVNGTIKALGVDTLDFIDFELRAYNGAAATEEELHMVAFNRSTNKIFALENVGDDTVVAITNADVLELRYFAVGDAHSTDVL
jgi:hypothetical protein